jgi:hypothetical protein
LNMRRETATTNEYGSENDVIDSLDI